ncbi:MAG: putative rane protein [Nocardia sp.]|nr:putative rane protein [Nocardia sp.]
MFWAIRLTGNWLYVFPGLHHEDWRYPMLRLRHPNYFGEFTFWLSLGLFGLAAAPHDWWWVFLGAIALCAMFQGASIPMMEKRSLERRPDYQDVIDRVPRFVPRPPRKERVHAA